VKVSADSRWEKLAGAAIGARDDLRRLASDLTAAMAAGCIPRVLITDARDTAARHADRLRIALKHPVEAPRRKFNRDAPCWSQQDGGMAP
jgi:hypothetical protein